MSPESTSVRPERRAVVGLVALALAAFSFVTTEILPIGLLPLLARAMGRSESVIGLLVTGYAVIVLVASVPLARRTQRMPRRQVLVGTLVVFVVATLLSAMATSFLMLLAARLVTALAQSLFWSVVASTAAGLFPPAMRGRAIARFAIGSALAPVLGVPFVVWLGQATSWRVPFLVMAGAGTVAGLAVLATLPRDRARTAAASVGLAPDRGAYLTLLIVTGLAVTGVMGTFTYITPFLTEVGGFAPATLGPLLLVSGVAGIVGTWSIGALLDRSPRHALVAPLLVATAALAGLTVFGATPWGAIAGLAALGLGFNAFAPAVQSRTLHVAPGDVDVASAGSSAVFNAGIAAGSLVGGFVLSGPGPGAVPVLGLVAAAAALAFAGHDLRRSAAGPRVGTANDRCQGRVSRPVRAAMPAIRQSSPNSN
ncbi:MFS transporter [Asanoa sp. NPDC049573]|uniref:MFS transporter n=1 Tax=Asanoa sp. NPDC049573 TaxID=3155396 RepID=UPI003445B0AB